VVIAIIAILASLLLPTLQGAKEAAHRAGCINNQKQIVQGVLFYSDDWDATLPPGWLTWENRALLGYDCTMFWWNFVMPYLNPGYVRSEHGDVGEVTRCPSPNHVIGGHGCNYEKIWPSSSKRAWRKKAMP